MNRIRQIPEPELFRVAVSVLEFFSDFFQNFCVPECSIFSAGELVIILRKNPELAGNASFSA